MQKQKNKATKETLNKSTIRGDDRPRLKQDHSLIHN